VNARAILLACPLLVCSACVVAIGDDGWGHSWSWDGDYDVESTETRTIPVGARTDLSVAALSGDVSVVPGPPGRVELELVRRAETRADLERLEVLVEHAGASLDVRVEIPDGVRGRVDVSVMAPSDTAAAIDTGSGDVTISGLSRAASARVGSGDVGIRNVAGSVTVDTGSGDVLVAGASDGVEVETGSGDVRAREVRGRLLVSTGSGDVEVAGTPTGDSRVRTGSGDVEIELTGAALDFTVSTGSGDIDVDTRGTKMRGEGGEMSGRIGGGGAGRLLVSTGSGDVELTSTDAVRP